MTKSDSASDAIALSARPSATGKDRINALDGMRGIALLFIMGAHFGVSWLQGGLFSLDFFYVLSGYLITGLLLSEYRRRDSIKLSAFWLRRARRLLPALFLMLIVVTLLVRFDSAPGLYPDFRMSALSALFYFSNWWQIAISSNYFVITGAVSPLTHTWSLAVEEQFYLIWPLVVLAIMTLSRSFVRGLRVLLILSVVGTIASALEMALLYSPTANVTRLYFGTDTHAQSILVGATLACILTTIQMRRGEDGMAPLAISLTARRIVGCLGVVGTAGWFTLIYVSTGLSPLNYRGGFLLAALSSAAMITGAACVPTGIVARGFTFRPLVWLGLISYGAYLWHFPIFVFLNASRTGFGGIGLLALRCVSTVVVAAASYYLVERPVMYGTFWRSVKAIPPAIALMVATVAVIIGGTIVPAAAAVQVQQFSAETANAKPPVLVILGDSTAYTLGFALAATAPSGIKVVNGGLFGCGTVIGTSVSNNPPMPELTMFPHCNSATPPNNLWPAVDARTVAHTAPGDLVVFVAGSWESQDMLRNGKWMNIEQPAYQRYILGQLRLAVRIGIRHGAHFDFTTMPPLATGAAFHEAPFPEDSPTRRLLYDSLIKKVAAEFPGKVSILDYGHILAPNGVYTEYLNGVQIRTPDGAHTPAYAPGNAFAGNSTEPVAHAFYNWISPRIWPLIIASNPAVAHK